MTARRKRVAILGGGMAGLAAAWRLSEPGWQDELESITVFQRGWRLGGKGASSRGVHGRIEEHGLHIWLGYYENAFRLLRECYAELDRPNTDAGAPIQSWRDAIIPAPVVGLYERGADGWTPWIGDFARNDELPGEPDAGGGAPMTVADFVGRAMRLLGDFLVSLQQYGPVTLSASAARRSGGLLAVGRDDPRSRRAWHLASVVLATMRGIVADGLLTDRRGFRAINDEDYRVWIRRHGATEEAVESTLVSGLYDLVFAHQDGDPQRASFGAGWGVFLSGKTFFDFKGAIFWKMTAGMGDVVFAPLYEALRRRGVRFELFHRVDQLHLSADRSSVDRVTIGVQAAVRDGGEYLPLIRVNGLPCFPAAPLIDQLELADGADPRSFESHAAPHHDVQVRTLRAGHDFDTLVLAIPVGMARYVCTELVADQAAWRNMVEGVRTVATQALQLWLREDEATLGWSRPGVTMTGYQKPLDTWSSMPQTIDAEDWPPTERPGTIAYFCGTLDANGDGDHIDHVERVRANALRFVERDLRTLLPGIEQDGKVRWELFCGADGSTGDAALRTQHVAANVDPSDRYVQSVAGTDEFRLRPDESGYSNLVLAGDWTDCGLNAGCIEAAVMSGLQAANAVTGHSQFHRIAGLYLR